jgi:hypothetical protein
LATGPKQYDKWSHPHRRCGRPAGQVNGIRPHGHEARRLPGGSLRASEWRRGVGCEPRAGHRVRAEAAMGEGAAARLGEAARHAWVGVDHPNSITADCSSSYATEDREQRRNVVNAHRRRSPRCLQKVGDSTAPRQGPRLLARRKLRPVASRPSCGSSATRPRKGCEVGRDQRHLGIAASRPTDRRESSGA